MRLTLAAALALLPVPLAAAEPQMIYPKTAATGAPTTLFGESVADPYRWLENDVRTDTAVRAHHCA